MILEIFIGLLALVFIVYYLIGIETTWINLLNPGKWSFGVPTRKITEFKTCDNKFVWTPCSQKEQKGKPFVTEWVHLFHKASDGVRTGSGPEKTGLFIQIEVRTVQIKVRTQSGPIFSRITKPFVHSEHESK